MAMSNSRLAFKDCYELFDLALNDPKGVKVRFDRNADAWHMRHRMHHARTLARRDNKKIYEEGHPLHGLSEFDKITVRIEKDEHGFWLRLTKIEASAFKTVSLTEEDHEDDEQQALGGDGRTSNRTPQSGRSGSSSAQARTKAEIRVSEVKTRR